MIELTSADCLRIPRGTLFTFVGVPNLNPRPLVGHVVQIDGAPYRVIGVETYAVYDATGMNFGLLVDGSIALLRRYLQNHCENADADGMSTLCECRLCLDTRAELKKHIYQ